MNERAHIIWTASAIGRRIGVSADFVRDTLAKMDGSPVRQIGTRYCAVESDLIAFFRADPSETHSSTTKPVAG
jgi:hypothetical protein